MPFFSLLAQRWREGFVSLAVAAACAVALLFDGTNLDVLSLSLGLLVVALGCALWWNSSAGLKLPRTSLLVTMLLYWGWLAATLAWNPVAYIGTTMGFWWQSILPLAFLVTTLQTGDRAPLTWSAVSALVLLASLGLMLHGAYQAFVLNQPPRSLFLDINMHAAMLNLVALPTAGYLLIHLSSGARSRYLSVALAAAFFLLVYGTMLTRSRGALLTLLLGLGLLVGGTYRRVPVRAIATVLAAAALAYAGAELTLQGDLTARIGTLADPASAGAERWLIWRQSWELLWQSPWWGAGVGLYPLVWAPYRHPDDGSAGYFAHNDYLQLWIEAGLPGLLLFLAVLASVVWLYARVMRDKAVSPECRVEATGLFAGVTAIAAHALIEFPFYIAPILVVYGLVLARIQFLAMTQGLAGTWTVRPGRFFSRQGLRIILPALALLPLVYFVSVGASSRYMDRGVELAAEGRLDEADDMLMRAMRLRPDSDSILIARADLRRHVLDRNPALDPQSRATLFENADRLLTRAERLNPLRPTTFLVRAELYRSQPELTGARWRDKVEQAYRTALERNPRFYPARYRYGRFVLAQGDMPRAFRILDAGASYGYAEDPKVAPYLLLTSELRERAGDVAGAEALRKRLAAYQAHRGETDSFRPKTRPSLLTPAENDLDAAPAANPR
jgi:O-antigen ligase/Tfp pilus assembly protein PilF